MSETPEKVWSSLPRPSHGVTAKRHPVSSDLWLAVDSQGRRHLLVRVASEPGIALMVTHGLRAETTEMSVEDGPLDVWADISCTDPMLNPSFLAVAADLAVEVADSDARLTAVERTLKKWRWFWGVDPEALSSESAAGLFGELWFLDRWAPLPQAVTAWHGPMSNRHDFSGTEISVEIKTTRSQADGPPTHHISNLDQLSEPEAGELYLFSLQAIPDPSAGNTLPALVDRVRARLEVASGLLELFDERLALVGWSPAHAQRHDVRYRIAAERLYAVAAGFPRLTRSSFPGGLPTGLDDVSYTLDLNACSAWLVATAPSQAATTLAGMS